MPQNVAPDTVFDIPFANCYLSDDRPRHVNKIGTSRAIPFLSFDDDLYREPGPHNEPRITRKFKATKAICSYDKDGPTSPKFWNLFKTLPIKVRNNIYKLLIFAWSPDAQYARLSRNGRRFAISRRIDISRPLSPENYLSDDPLGVTEEDLDEWTQERDWEQSEGVLDFFKLNEYWNIQRLVWFLEKVESTLQLDKAKTKKATRDRKGKGKEVKSREDADHENINLWEEVLAFFWDNVIVDFGERLHYGTVVLRESARQKNLHKQRCTTKNQHSEVKHLCIHLSTIMHSREHTVHSAISDDCDVCRFLLLCQFIREHFPNVETLILYLTMATDEMQFFTANHEEVAQDVIGAIRSLKVSKELYAKLRIVNEDQRKDGAVEFDDNFLDDWSKQARRWFQECLFPDKIPVEPDTVPNTPE
ncbi:hypothetical protein NHQ30_002913 [Ciborinia camelliae]|nr:hypothetical protein NHQ30_002913 [Ciborinia camelliae]